MPLQWHRPETPVCFVRTSKETRAVSKINRLALITMFAKHGPSLVRQGATRSYNHLCLWIFCRICINTAVRQRHIHPITIKVICQNTVPLRQQPIFKGLDFLAKALHCADVKKPGAFMYMCVCLYARLSVCASARVRHTEERAGPSSLERRRLMVDEWCSRCLSIFSSKHPRQAGRRGSWEHEVVQLWTVDFHFNWVNWKVKPPWSWQCQPQLW